MDRQIVHTTSLFSVDSAFEDERFCRVRVAAMHSGINRNNSRFSVETIKNAIDTFKNIPILAEVKEVTDENGNKTLDYTTHAMHIEEDYYDKDSQRIIYDEKVVGIVPESNNIEVVFDSDSGNYYVWLDALLYREYGNYCVDVLEERGGTTEVSMEIACEDMSFSAEDKCLDVGKMTACAITLLGDAVTPGMAKAHATTFAISDSDRQTQLIELLSELNKKLDKFNILNLTKGGTTEEMTLFEKLMEQYGVTTEDISFEYEGLSDEELTAKFAEVFGETETSDEAETETEEGAETESTAEAEVTQEDPQPETESNYSYKYSVSNPEGLIKDFEISLDDKQMALSSLVNSLYESDETWYYVTVYETYVIMSDYWSNRHYKQSYTQNEADFSLDGERVEVFINYLTKEEEANLAGMRATYEETIAKYNECVDKLAKYEAEPDKIAILESAEYSQITDTAEFAELKTNHFDLTTDEVRSKCDEILLSCAKSGKVEFAKKEEVKKTSSVGLGSKANKNTVGRYGGTFSK